MAEFEIIEDVSKALPKGKDLKKMTPFIIGGLVLGLGALLFTRRTPTVDDQPMSDDGVGDDVDLGGVLSDFANQTSQAISQNNQEMSYQMSEVTENLLGLIGQQNSMINQLQKDLEEQLSQISQPQYVPVYQQASAIQNYSTQSTGQDNFSIYFDGEDDDIQYNNLVRNTRDMVRDGLMTREESDRVKREIAGTGNNGVGWTAEGHRDNQERMRNDPSYIRSEMERAQLVIENRRSQGLSTDGQERYLARLVSGEEYKP